MLLTVLEGFSQMENLTIGKVNINRCIISCPCQSTLIGHCVPVRPRSHTSSYSRSQIEFTFISCPCFIFMFFVNLSVLKCAQSRYCLHCKDAHLLARYGPCILCCWINRCLAFMSLMFKSARLPIVRHVMRLLS